MLESELLLSNSILFTVLDMKNLNVHIDGDELGNVPFASNHPDDVGRNAYWQHDEIEINSSMNNETLSLHVVFKDEDVLIFVGKVAAPAVFTHKLDDGRKLTLALQ